jgi:hypothetical protein
MQFRLLLFRVTTLQVAARPEILRMRCARTSSPRSRRWAMAD